MKKFFFLMVALVVVLTSCQEKYSCDIAVRSNNVSGWVTFKTPVLISQEDMCKLQTDLTKIAEECSSPKELKSLVRHKIRSIGCSCISFKIENNGMMVRWDVNKVYSNIAAVFILVLFILGLYKFCIK